MKSKLFVTILLSSVLFVSCTKEPKTILTYVYTEGLEDGQTAKLYIDDAFVSELRNTHRPPVLCNDSTLVDCFQIELKQGRHDYALHTSTGQHICSGYVKVKGNRSAAGANRGQSGSISMMSNSNQEVMLIGMNVQIDPNQTQNSCD